MRSTTLASNHCTCAPRNARIEHTGAEVNMGMRVDAQYVCPLITPGMSQLALSCRTDTNSDIAHTIYKIIQNKPLWYLNEPVNCTDYITKTILSHPSLFPLHMHSGTNACITGSTIPLMKDTAPQHLLTAALKAATALAGHRHTLKHHHVLAGSSQ